MSKTNAPMSANGIKGEKTDVKYGSSNPYQKGKSLGSTDMGIPPFTQKVRNLEKVSNIAKTSKGKSKGSDKYC